MVDYEEGSYSSFSVHISKLKVGEKEYNFPTTSYGLQEVCFGDPTLQWWHDKFPYPAQIYSNNFAGINIASSHSSLKTVLIVEPNIIGSPNSTGYDSQGLADDPYKFIKVEGRLN